MAALCAFGPIGSGPAAAAEQAAPIHSHYGGVGLIRTRTARMAPDSTLTSLVEWTAPQQRYGVTFQAAPWLETTFSYSLFDVTRPGVSDTADRQFDLKIRLWEESAWMPEVALGLQDFLGTGLFSGEYIVASKQLGPLDLSFGVGWGQLASRGDVDNPLRVIADGFGSRDTDFGQGGEVNFGQFFRGESIGFFGGVSYQTPIKGLQLLAEYDSDSRGAVRGLDDDPFNFGLVYNYSPGIQLRASYIGLDEVSLGVAFSAPVGEWALDEPPGQPPPAFYVREGAPAPEPMEGAPITPLQPRVASGAGLTGDALGETLASELDAQGLDLVRLTEGAQALRLTIRNNRYRAVPKAVGRAARILSAYAPPQIERFNIAIEQRGMETAEFALDRSVLERSAQEIGYGVAPPSLAFSYITPGADPVEGPTRSFDVYPDFNWSFGPDVRFSFFDPDDPLRFQVDAELSASVELAPGLSVSTDLGYGLFGTLDDATRSSDSVLPRVRSESNRYAAETDLGVYRLVGEYYFSPAPNVYAKVSGGLLEQMFAGAGGEVLYRPPNSRFAYGAELYAVKQRDFDTLFSFQDYETVTGHLSAYYASDYNNWNVAVHAGRYLARDWGATLELSRRFSNGWEIGAFATLTDVPFDEFGEGSFDKGLTFRIPFDWQLGRDSGSSGRLTVRPLLRDGGARLNPGERLFRLTQPTSRGDVAPQWSNFAH